MPIRLLLMLALYMTAISPIVWSWSKTTVFVEYADAHAARIPFTLTVKRDGAVIWSSKNAAPRHSFQASLFDTIELEGRATEGLPARSTAKVKVSYDDPLVVLSTWRTAISYSAEAYQKYRTIRIPAEFCGGKGSQSLAILQWGSHEVVRHLTVSRDCTAQFKAFDPLSARYLLLLAVDGSTVAAANETFPSSDTVLTPQFVRLPVERLPTVARRVVQ